MHPNHVLALAHQHHADLLADADRRRFARAARSTRRHGKSLRDLTLDARLRERRQRPHLRGASPPLRDLSA